MTTITVTGTNPYDVVVGPGVRHQVLERLGAGVERVLVIHAPAVRPEADNVVEELRHKLHVNVIEAPDAEGAKIVEFVAACWAALGQANFARSDAIVSIGGGATTDVAGFVAATWLRGVRIVHIPTTVLGSVDASVGGKTGINTAEGKNLVGAFHAPEAVLVDTELLATLPDTEVRTGYAEIAKAGFIADPVILDLIDQDAAACLDVTSATAQDALARAIRVKADVVGEDFTDKGRREILNYGHTLGHAIEYAERYRWRHGVAISIGMNFAAELSRLTRSLSDADVERHRLILGERLGLPLTYPIGRWDTLRAAMNRDKKTRGSALRFVLLDGIGRPVVAPVADDSLLFAAYSEIAG